MNISIKLSENDNEELSKEIKNLLNQYFSATQRDVIRDIIDKKFQEKIESLENYIDSIFKDLAEKITNHVSAINLDRMTSEVIYKIIKETECVSIQKLDELILKGIELKTDELPKNRIRTIFQEFISEEKCKVQIKFDN